jgi:hypothetical protein
MTVDLRIYWTGQRLKVRTLDHSAPDGVRSSEICCHHVASPRQVDDDAPLVFHGDALPYPSTISYNTYATHLDACPDRPGTPGPWQK